MFLDRERLNHQLLAVAVHSLDVDIKDMMSSFAR